VPQRDSGVGVPVVDVRRHADRARSKPQGRGKDPQILPDPQLPRWNTWRSFVR
jgi:hypothetical protein